MDVHLENQQVDYVVPPLSDEEIAALKAMGARFPTGGPVRDFEPVKMRPRWLAFLLRIIGRA
jgi:hypothetical protein